MTRSNKPFWLAITIPVIALSVAQQHPPKARAEQVMNRHLLMEVNLAPSPKETTLEIGLTAKGAKPIRLYQDSLPWESRYSMVLIAVKANRTGDLLKKYMPVDDPGVTVVVLNPGQPMKGRIALNKRFPDLVQTLQESDVLLFWSYQLEPLDGAPLERQGGWLLIPKSRD